MCWLWHSVSLLEWSKCHEKYTEPTRELQGHYVSSFIKHTTWVWGSFSSLPFQKKTCSLVLFISCLSLHSWQQFIHKVTHRFQRTRYWASGKQVQDNGRPCSAGWSLTQTCEHSQHICWKGFNTCWKGWGRNSIALYLLVSLSHLLSSKSLSHSKLYVPGILSSL